MTTAEDLLDLAPNVGQRASTIRWDVLDQTLSKIGEVQPDTDPTSRITLNVNRTVKRDLQAVTLGPSEQADLNPFAHRLRPTWVLSTGDEYPCGVFVLGSMDRLRWEWGLDARVTAVDQTIILDDPIVASIALDTGDDVRAAIVAQFVDAAVPSYNVDPEIATTIGAPILWPVGTSRLQVLNDLAAMAGAYSAFFDNDGVGRVIRIPDLTAGDPDHVYASGGRIIAGTMVESDDLLEAPNRFLVIDTSARDVPVFGVYHVPDEAAHSFVNRGFYVTETIEEQGLTSNAEAEARALAAYAQSRGGYQWVQFSSPPDPRHDTFQTVEYLGERYREQGWSLVLEEGTEMTHDLRRVYT